MDAEPEVALKSAQTTLRWALRHRGPDAAMTVIAKREVAELLERSGRLDEALDLRNEVATSLRSQLGADDPSTLVAEAFQGFTLERLGRPAEALPHFEHVVAVRTTPWGPTTGRRCWPWIGSDVRIEVSGTFKSPVGYFKKRWIDTKPKVRARPRTV